MENIIEIIIEFIIGSVLSFFTEVTILLLLAGLALISLGFLIIAYHLFSVFKGQKVDGTVIGAVKDVKISVKEGVVIKKRLNFGTLFPIFEYTLSDGTTHRDKGSTGGSHVYNYKTGQHVKLVVRVKEKYNEVNDSKSYAAYVFGGILIGFGLYFVYFYIVTFASFNVSFFVWLGAIVSIGFKFKNKLFELFKKYKLNKENYNEAYMLRRQFDPEQVRPIEEYVEERRNNKAKHRS